MCTVADAVVIARNERFAIRLQGVLDSNVPHIVIEDEDGTVVWNGLILPDSFTEFLVEWIARDQLALLREKCIRLEIQNAKLKMGVTDGIQEKENRHGSKESC